MSKTKCSYEHCKKEIKTPIVVTSFSFTPQKITYYACPYCLTKIDDMTKTKNCTSYTTNQSVCNVNKKLDVKRGTQPEKSTMDQRVLDEPIILQEINLEKIENLEKEKQDLLAEFGELKNRATKKISDLEKEVVSLRQEAEILKKLTQH